MGASTNDNALSGFQDLLKKCESSLMPAIEEHVSNEAFDATKNGLDFLEVKNSLLLSYLIDLTLYTRKRVSNKHDAENYRRLMETRTVLDKTRPLEKKMRYQLDKLLAATRTTSFASGTSQDPLTFRPNPNAMDGSREDSDDDSDDSDVEENDDLEVARATLSRAASSRNEDQEDDQDNDGLYRAPRLASMPYTLDVGNHEEERQKRQNQRARQSELAQTLRNEFGDAPEQADVHGGSEYGKQREAARRMAEREALKTKVEEEHFIRLTTTRKEKKERKRLMRQEGSNLSAIANMGNVVRGVSSAFGGDGSDDDDGDLPEGFAVGGRYSNGKRKRGTMNEATGRSRASNKSSRRQPRNEFQQALYGKPDKNKKKR